MGIENCIPVLREPELVIAIPGNQLEWERGFYKEILLNSRFYQSGQYLIELLVSYPMLYI